MALTIYSKSGLRYLKNERGRNMTKSKKKKPGRPKLVIPGSPEWMKEAAENLPDLTPKQMDFVRGLLEGRTASDAYRAAYDAEGMATPTINAAASRLRTDHKIAAWLQYLRFGALETGTITLEQHASELVSLRDQARAAGQFSAAITAEIQRGKALGLYDESLVIKDMRQSTDALAVLEAALGEEMAGQIATLMGVQRDNEERLH